MSEIQEPEIFDVMRKLRYQATALQAGITTALNMLASMNWPISGVECPQCGAHLRQGQGLADHLANVHGFHPFSTAEKPARVEQYETHEWPPLSTSASPARVERSRAIENDENSRGIR